MVRVFIKGGVWKNSEDEILKAAVMKYGKQQWARVASLLNRKSAKQCKARWNEWLDPSVRKVEWSRAEDEKLLHLAKLMPAQWRTIGPLVGRTAGQCQERYERLLDEAAAAAGVSEPGAAVEGGETDVAAALPSSSSSARGLRPGEIDPHPETRPARPDPVDMDEDEVEMLQEARARLANTQGKKAKRKQREKALAEAKRMADLQKRRELKAAGLLASEMRTRGRRGRDIDLGVEIPFHKPAPTGFHGTRDEDATAEALRNQRLKDVDYRRVTESQTRARDREAKERQKREESRLRSLERSNMQYVVAEVSRRNDPIASRKRGALSMPEPTIGDDELRRVAKAGEEERAAIASLSSSGEGGEALGGGATDALLGDYTDRALPTPMRTPAASALAARSSLSEVIQREAMNLRALSSGQTPLLGEENAHLLDGGAGTGASLNGGASAAAAAAFGSTPMIDRAGGGIADDVTAGGRSAWTTATPRRDELGLNAGGDGDGGDNRHTRGGRPPSELRSVTDHEDDAASVGGASLGASSFGASTFASTKNLSIRELAREERRRAKRARRELEEALANLPAPQFEYELGVPEDVVMDEADDEGGAMMIAKDRADEDKEELERLRRAAEKLYEEQSSVSKRGELPRPRGGGVLDRLRSSLADAPEMDDDETALDAATRLIYEEMATLINHDARCHPIAQVFDPIIAGVSSGGKKDKKDKKRKHQSTMEDIPEVLLEFFPEEELESAKLLLAQEFKVVFQEKRELLSSTKGVYYDEDTDVLNALVAETMAASHDGATGLFFSTDNGASGWHKGCDDISTLRSEHSAIQNATKSMSKACAKLEQKLQIQTGGYVQRSGAIIESTLNSFAELQHSRIEQSVYSRLRAHETKGVSLRLEMLTEEVEELEEVEMNKQKRYGELIHEKNRLLLKIYGMGKKMDT
jgi:pre-mRNA-splicing factor CDC5/CEF1